MKLGFLGLGARSITPSLWGGPGEAIVLDLAPLGSVSVRFGPAA